jgi:hypothetical protein
VSASSRSPHSSRSSPRSRPPRASATRDGASPTASTRHVTKPVDFDRFIEVVRQIDDFFVTVVKLPSR